MTAASSVSAPRLSAARLLWSVFTNPRAVFQEHLGAVPAPLCLLVSGLAFGLFYFQTGLDVGRSRPEGFNYALTLAILGVLMGTLGVAVLALIAWVLTRPCAGPQSVGWAVRAFALAYSPALIYAGMGLVANLLLGWNTALAFGMTGVLWAVGPMLVAVREMTGHRTLYSVIIATVCGALTLLGWAMLVQ